MATDSLWPGFHPRSTPVAVFDGQDTWLLNHPNPPPGFTPTNPTTPAGAVGSILRYRGRHPAVSANTSTLLGGVPTAAVLARTELTADPVSWAGVALHEAFHAFQERRHPSWGPNEADMFRYPVDSVPALTGRRLETEAWRRYLEATAGGETRGRCWASRALGYREARYRLLDSTAIGYERETERFEGLARYVESRATGIPPRVPATGFPPEDVRLRSYTTGSVMALALDDAAPGWRRALEDDDRRYLDQLLATAVGTAPCPAAGQTLDTDSVARAARAAVDSLRLRRSAERGRLMTAPGWTIQVVATGARLFPSGFDPLNVALLDGGEVLHRRYLRLENAGGWVELYDRAAITQGTPAHPLFAGVVALTIPGLPGRPVVRDSSGTLILRADRVTARLTGAALSWGERVLRVHLP